MAQTIAGIVCQELVEAFGEGFDSTGGPTARKGYLCAWVDRYTVANGLLGLSNTTNVGGGITLTTPAQYPQRTTMYATNIEIRGAGPPTQGTQQLQYTYAVLMVSYQCLPWSFQGVDFMQLDYTHPFIYAEQSFNFTSEWITVPGRNTYYLTSWPTKKLDQDWGFRSPIVNFTITLKYVPYLPVAQILIASQSPINSTTFLGCSPGFLLFNGADSHSTRAVDGTFTQEVSYSFSYRPIAPWDYVFNGSLPGWDRVVDSAGNPIQQRSDISTVFPSGY